MMEKDVESYVKCKNQIKRLLITAGVWPEFRKQALFLNYYLTVQAVFLGWAAFSGIAYSCYLHSTDVGIFTSYVGGLIGYFTTIIKILVLALQQRDLTYLNNGISASFEANLKVPENRPHLLAHYRTFASFFHTYFFSTGTSMILLALMPLLMIRHGVYIRMLPQTIPFSYKPGGLVHWIIYVFEICCGLNLWSVAVSTDNLFAMYCLHIVGELKLLGSRFRNLKSSNNYPNDMKGCIQSHVMIMETFSKLQKVFGFLALWFSLSCATCLCSLVFQAVDIDKVSPVKVFYLFVHSFVKLFQVYLYTWFGNVITVESEICLGAAYEARWSSSGNKRFMKDILTVVLQRPMVFKANKILELRMELFMKILNTSVSYFFLLRTINENE